MMRRTVRRSAAAAVVFGTIAALGWTAEVNAQTQTSDEEEPTRFGVGFQSSWPAYGISGLYDIDERLTAQAVLGAFGALSTISARGLYHFQREHNYTVFGYGTVGLWRHSFRRLTASETESSIGIGGGAGVELNWRRILDDGSRQNPFPPIFSSFDLGFVVASFDHFNFSGFVVGVGTHYRF